MGDLELMQSIKAKWSAEITSACSNSSISPAFLAALIANESGGDLNAKRFEKGVLVALWEVLLGRKASYGSITTKDLILFAANVEQIPVSAPQSLPADTYQRFDSLATSWGLTQIMGYEAIAFHLRVDALKNPDTALVITTQMLVQFSERFGLDLAADFKNLFDCWNTGRPHSPTADPQYIPDGLERMKLWGQI